MNKWLKMAMMATALMEEAPSPDDAAAAAAKAEAEAKAKAEAAKKAAEDAKKGKAQNLMDDGEEAAEPFEPTEDEMKAFREGIKGTDLGEGVKFDDEALAAMEKPLMQLTGGDPKKGEALVKAYTDFRQKEIAKAEEAREAFIGGLVDEAKKRFGDDLKQMVNLAKAGGKKIFGDELWNQIKSVPEFANNPDIIEKLAAFGRSTTNDIPTPKTEKAVKRSSDWRENMYGGKK